MNATKMWQQQGPGGIIDPRGIGWEYMGEWNGLFPNYYPANAYLLGVQGAMKFIKQISPMIVAESIW